MSGIKQKLKTYSLTGEMNSFVVLMRWFWVFFLFYHALQHLSSPTRDLTHSPCFESIRVWDQTVKNLPVVQEMQFQSLDWEDALEKEMAPHSRILAWRIPWTQEPSRLQSMGLQRVGQD